MKADRNIRTPAIAGVLLWAALSAVGRGQNCTGPPPSIAIAGGSGGAARLYASTFTVIVNRP
jgi:hypothetical protein